MGTKEDIFEHPMHPYTKSLLAAVPEPNPHSKNKVVETYDKDALGIDYEKGTKKYVSDTHMVLM